MIQKEIELVNKILYFKKRDRDRDRDSWTVLRGKEINSQLKE